MPQPCAFAYLLERYPAFTQTFIVREVVEMRRQGVDALVVSLRHDDEPAAGQFPPEATENVVCAPASEVLVAEIKRRRAAGELPKKINQRLEAWGKEPDKLRLYEAIWAGDLLEKRGVRHVHVHFAGLAARTACLVKELYGITFSWTGHAQDIFCKTDHAIDLGRLVREATAVVTVAEFSADHLRYRFPALAGKIHRVYNGIEVPQSPPRHGEKPPPLILSVGRLIAKKGFGDLVAACALLKNRGVAFRCEIVGDGPLQDELAAQIHELGLTNYVTLAGARSQEEIGKLLAEARCFALAAIVLPDGDSDNLPTVITEAMTHALPVVSTKVAGIPEQVIDGETGFIVSLANISEFSHQLQNLLEDQSLAEKLGQAGFARAEALFSLEKCVLELRKKIVPRPWWRALF